MSKIAKVQNFKKEGVLTPQSRISDLEQALTLAREKGAHSDFFVKLNEVTERIHIYKTLFLDK